MCYVLWYNVGSTEWNFVVLSRVGPNPIEIMVHLCYERMAFKIFTLRAIFHRDTTVTWLVTAIVTPSRCHGEIWLFRIQIQEIIIPDLSSTCNKLLNTKLIVIRFQVTNQRYSIL